MPAISRRQWCPWLNIPRGRASSTNGRHQLLGRCFWRQTYRSLYQTWTFGAPQPLAHNQSSPWNVRYATIVNFSHTQRSGLDVFRDSTTQQQRATIFGQVNHFLSTITSCCWLTRDTNSSTGGNSIINSVCYKICLTFHTNSNYIILPASNRP